MFSRNFLKSTASVFVLCAVAVGAFQFAGDSEEVGQKGADESLIQAAPAVAVLPVSALGNSMSSPGVIKPSVDTIKEVTVPEKTMEALFAQKDPNPKFDSFYHRYQSTLACCRP